MVLGAFAAIGQQQHQAADGLFLHRPCRLRADRPRRRLGSRAARPAHLHGDLPADEPRHLRRAGRDAPAGQGGREGLRSRRPRQDRPVAWRSGWRSSCSRWPASRRSPASSASSSSSRRRCMPACGRWPSSACCPRVVSAFYYLRIVKVMFFDESGRARSIATDRRHLLRDGRLGPVHHAVLPLPGPAGRAAAAGGRAPRSWGEPRRRASASRCP